MYQINVVERKYNVAENGNTPVKYLEKYLLSQPYGMGLFPLFLTFPGSATHFISYNPNQKLFKAR